MANKGDFLKLIRQNCAECMGGPCVRENAWPVINPGDIAECTAKDCAYYLYRFGSDPVKSPQRVEAGRRLAQMHSSTHGPS